MEPIAKSAPRQTLREHTKEVMQAVNALTEALAAPLRVCMPNDQERDAFLSMLQWASFFHDLGKAASGFQAVVTAPVGKKAEPWRYRHEVLSSAILLASGLPTISDQRLLFAVLTHHRTVDGKYKDEANLADIVGLHVPLESYVDGGDGKKWRRKVAELAGYWQWIVKFVSEAEHNGYIPLLPCSLPSKPEHLPNLHHAAREQHAVLENCLDLTTETLPWILARGLLMAGDHLASAGLLKPRTELNGGKIIAPQGFQQTLQATVGNVLLEAPTGAGKTEAALHWALANRRGGERIFYVLPYQASINKMTVRLKRLFGDENVGFLHHRAAFQEFTRYFQEGNTDYDTARKQAARRMDETKQFYLPLKILTPYQLLKLMFGCMFFEIGLAELLGGLVIFDEIHAYDPHTVALLEIMVSRLRVLDVRFLMMSATFPPFLKKRLQHALGESHVVSVRRSDVRAEKLLKTARHQLHIHNRALEELIEDAIHDVEKGQKVLVVCNRVSQAQRIFEQIRDDQRTKGKKLTLLHSRLISGHRTDVEQKLVAFPDAQSSIEQQIPSADILVATQVVEVSLNLSFQTIYTEAAPAEALLQRFGRVNRDNQEQHPVPVHVAALYDSKAVRHIYLPEVIEKTLHFAPDRCKLYAAIERRWVRNTYRAGYTSTEQEEYDMAAEAFEKTMNMLRPGYNGNDEDFYDLFDNYNVVPVRFRQKYQDCIQAKQYYRAAEYVCSLSSPTFMAMHSYAKLDAENHVWYMDRRYDDTLGLLNEPETDRAYVQKEIDDRLC